MTKHSVRRGAEVVITEDMLSLWRPQDVLMAQLELLMVFQALVTFPMLSVMPQAYGILTILLP